MLLYMAPVYEKTDHNIFYQLLGCDTIIVATFFKQW